MWNSSNETQHTIFHLQEAIAMQAAYRDSKLVSAVIKIDTTYVCRHLAKTGIDNYNIVLSKT